MSDDQTQITDADLIAYLDETADAASRARIDAVLAHNDDVVARLDAMNVSKDAISAAYDLAKLDSPPFPNELLTSTPRAVDRVTVALGLAASFTIGMFVMASLRPAPTWVDTIASYHALYVTETLDGATQSPDVSGAVLQSAQEVLGVDLRPATTLPGLTFKRAQILAIDGQPLLQMAYLDEAGLPFAFCVTRQRAADQKDTQRMSHDLATNSWIEDGVGYLFVGGVDFDRVAAVSTQLQQQL